MPRTFGFAMDRSNRLLRITFGLAWLAVVNWIFAATGYAATFDPTGDADPTEVAREILSAPDAPDFPLSIQTLVTQVAKSDIRTIGTPGPLPEGMEGEEPLADSDKRAVPGNGQAPRISVIAPDRVLRVGESRTVTFVFNDPENDPLLAGAIAFVPQPAREGRFFSRTRIRTDRAQLSQNIDIEVVPSPSPNAIVWRLTALRPGTAIVHLLATELFADTRNGNLRLRAGNLSFDVLTLTVADETANVPAPRFDDLPGDFTLRKGEAFTWTGTSRSAVGRPLWYGFSAIGFAGQIVESRTVDNSIRLKAVEAGRALLVGYVTDGFTSQAFARRVTVEPDAAPKPVRPAMRALSANVFATPTVASQTAPTEVTVFGDGLESATQATIVSERGDLIRTVPFEAESDTRGTFAWVPGMPGGYALWLNDATGRQLTQALPLRVVAVNVTSVMRLRRSANAPVNALLIRGQGLGNAPTVVIDGQAFHVLVKRSLRNRLSSRVLVMVPEAFQNKPAVTVQVINEAGFLSDVFFLPLQ